MIFRFKPYVGQLIIDQADFFSALQSYETIDVLTYTLGAVPLVSIRNVVCAVLCEPLPLYKELRIHTRLHTKMFLCYQKGKIKNVFIGSQNCRKGFNLNVSFQLPTSAHKECVHYFNDVWLQSLSLKTAIANGKLNAQYARLS